MELLELYARIIAVANYFLRNASHLTLEAMKDFDPSVDTIARTMRTLATILKDLAGDSYDDENMALNAFQCCLIMERIANAVSENDGEELEALVAQLEMHTNVP